MTNDVITCAACDDTDGPFKPVDPANDIYLCETCIAITQDGDQ